MSVTGKYESGSSNRSDANARRPERVDVNNGILRSISNPNKSTININGVDDGNKSITLKSSQYVSDSGVVSDKVKNIDSEIYQSIKHTNNLYDRNDINLFDKTYRFGLFNPYGAVTTTREFIFFTKPDLHIKKRDDATGTVSNYLNEGLQGIPFWEDATSKKDRIVELLQDSYHTINSDKFNHLLQNQVISNLEVPGLSAETIDTAQNMYGVGFSYRGSSEASDDSPEFSLEFKDTRWLDVYYFFKMYEEYETLKHHGVIRPWKKYIENKIIHDQFSIYKFLVDEDMETILYWGKYYGVMPKSLPRDVFSSANFDSGLSYSIDFKAAFYEDMRPEILADFNSLSRDYYNSLKYDIDIYNDIIGRVDNRPAKAAIVKEYSSLISPDQYVYKLKWRGDDDL